MTESETSRIVAVLFAAFPNSRSSSGTSPAYESMLRDLDYAATNAAISKLLATCKFMPTIAEIREATLSMATGEIKPGGEAWGSVLKAIREKGVHRQIGPDFGFKDPVTTKCVMLLNWAELCNSENTAADRARFIELYDRLAKTHRVEQLSGSLPAVVKFRELQEANRDEATKLLEDVSTRLRSVP